MLAAAERRCEGSGNSAAERVKVFCLDDMRVVCGGGGGGGGGGVGDDLVDLNALLLFPFLNKLLRNEGGGGGGGGGGRIVDDGG